MRHTRDKREYDGKMGGYVYIMANKPRGTLYIGVTSDLARRAYEHKHKLVAGFTTKYDLTMLVYWQAFETIEHAIQREKTMKHWVRSWKINAIEALNPMWSDLYEDLNR